MKIKLLFFLVPICLFAWGSAGLFKKFPNRYFVETGAWLGEGVEAALNAGFQEIHTIEIAEGCYRRCEAKFANRSNVHLWLGDSAILLEKVIAQMDAPITFWLDAHWCGIDSGKGEGNTPILRELEAIRRHPIKTHTILIDDIRHFNQSEFDNITIDEAIRIIKEINPNYVITFENGYQTADILVAKVILDK